MNSTRIIAKNTIIIMTTYANCTIMIAYLDQLNDNNIHQNNWCLIKNLTLDNQHKNNSKRLQHSFIRQEYYY